MRAGNSSERIRSGACSNCVLRPMNSEAAQPLPKGGWAVSLFEESGSERVGLFIFERTVRFNCSEAESDFSGAVLLAMRCRRIGRNAKRYGSGGKTAWIGPQLPDRRLDCRPFRVWQNSQRGGRKEGMWLNRRPGTPCRMGDGTPNNDMAQQSVNHSRWLSFRIRDSRNRLIGAMVNATSRCPEKPAIAPITAVFAPINAFRCGSCGERRGTRYRAEGRYVLLLTGVRICTG
ncbi:hypothetical protein SAMN04488026_101410 [Aliiruegeria lutimaris]|uniref:Uncharacterized protein n=1 Tax=Aliiruegeria lutimaris TaxID=571298 RepID=A0A1G8RXU2_9RHOB|nr:hypothetical protein SAMN04488026_101410 [Aliiruegeria lutimaris]